MEFDFAVPKQFVAHMREPRESVKFIACIDKS